MLVGTAWQHLAPKAYSLKRRGENSSRCTADVRELPFVTYVYEGPELSKHTFSPLAVVARARLLRRTGQGSG